MQKIIQKTLLVAQNLQNYHFWLIEVGKVGRTLLLAKAKSSKNFCALRVRFCGIVESSVDSAIHA